MYLKVDHNELVRSAFGLPPLPQSAIRLAHLLTGEEPNLREIIGVIECDPTLTMRLLRVANSATGASRHQIGTVQKAVIHLGTGAVAGFVIGSCVRPLTCKRIPGYNVAEEDFWRHSLAAAFAAQAIQAYAAKWKGSLAFTAALLHDIGKLVLGQFLDPERLAWLERAITEGHQADFDAETEILSLHHGEVGGIVAQHWGLPDLLVKGIAYHHHPEQGEDGICYVTYLANLIADSVVADPEIPLSKAMTSDEVHCALKVLGLLENNLADIGADVRKGLHAMSGHIG